MSYQIGNIIEGTVTGIQPYGAFVSLDKETQGLIHVSEIQSGFTKNIHEVLQVGQKIRVQIIDIDAYSQKISLATMTLESTFVPPPSKRKRYFTNNNKRIGSRTIEEILPDWTSKIKPMIEKDSNRR